MSWIKAPSATSRITSDMIVGFPGETDADFEETITLLGAVRYDAVFAFKFSPRPNTPAVDMPDSISDEVKIERLRILNDRQREIQREHYARHLGPDRRGDGRELQPRTRPDRRPLLAEQDGQLYPCTWRAAAPNRQLSADPHHPDDAQLPGRRSHPRCDTLRGYPTAATVHRTQLTMIAQAPQSATQAPDEVEMQIRGLMMDPVTNMPIIVLKDIASDTVLPIWVGIFEANAIALELEKTATPRPMTHDLMQNMARNLNAEVRKVVVSELRDDTFYAVIWMDHAGETVAMDARPSDAIALALRWDCPIYVNREVLENSKQAATGIQTRQLPTRCVAGSKI